MENHAIISVASSKSSTDAEMMKKPLLSEAEWWSHSILDDNQPL